MPVKTSILSNEKELFGLLHRGDETAFTQIFDFYEPLLFPFIVKITRSDTIAEEVVQEIFIKLWMNREKMGHVENYRSYIFKIASNKALNHLQEEAKKHTFIKKATSELAEEVNSTEETIQLRQLQKLVDNAVQQLPAQQKKVYTLSRTRGLSYDQIADELNISRSTAKNHLTEALRSIKEYLQKNQGISFALIMIMMRYYR